MFLFEGYCLGGTVQVQGEHAPTLQEAANHFSSLWTGSCIGDSVPLPNPLTWTADGSSNMAETNAPYGWVVDLSGNPLPSGTQSVTWVAASEEEPMYPGFTAPEIAEVFAWGFGAVVFFWFLGQCIGAAIGVIRRA